MIDDEFEWDDAKAADNLRDHGVSFESVKDVFRDPFGLEWLDASEDYGEDRRAIIGIVESRLLYVAFTMRGERIRVISARGAEAYERRRYHEESR
jgi:uncharacterized protein